MRNLKRALSLGLTAAMISGLMVMGSSAASYADVSSEDNVEAVDVLQAVGVMVGDEDGNFNPDEYVTRNEMAVVMSNLLALNVSNFTSSSIPFTDVPDWAAPYVAACYADGITSGTSDTTYGGDDTVTAAQAGLMMLKALGHFQYSSDFGSDWQLSAVRQASSIDLYDGVDAGASSAMTRNEVAQLALNALEATMVEPSSDGSTIVVGDITVSSNVSYDERTSSNSQYASISNDHADDSDSQYTIELGEELYDGDLEKSSADANEDVFGRPAVTWEYNNDEIGTYADDPEETYTAAVDKDALYDLIGSSVYNDLRDEETTLTVYVDGEEVEDVTLSSYIARNNDDDAEGTGRGVLTEVFVDDENNVTITQIHTYVAQVDGDYDEDNEELELTIPDENEVATPDVDLTLSSDNFDNLDQFSDEDYVLYTAAGGEIQTIEAAEVITGTVSAYTVGTSVTADGTRYYYNNTYTSARWDDEDVDDEDSGVTTNDLVTYSLGNDYTLVLDGYGYVIYSDGTSSVNDYVYVADMAHSGGVRGDLEADAYFVDGTSTVITIDNDDEFTVDDNSNDPQNPGWYLYDEKSNGDYELNEVDDDYSGTISSGTVTTNGSSTVYVGATGHNTVRANNSTIFVVNEDDDVTVYTGIRNVPDISANSTATVAVVMDGSYAEVVYIGADDLSISGESGDRVYILDTSYDRGTDEDDNDYYEYDAIVNGEESTIRTTSRSIVEGKGLYYDVSYDENDYVDGMDLVTVSSDEDDFKAYNVEGAVDYSSGVITFNDGDTEQDIVLADSYTIFHNDDGDAETWSTSQLERNCGEDFTGTIYVYEDDDMAVEIYVEGESTDVDPDDDETEVTDYTGSVTVNATTSDGFALTLSNWRSGRGGNLETIDNGWEGSNFEVVITVTVNGNTREYSADQAASGSVIDTVNSLISEALQGANYGNAENITVDLTITFDGNDDTSYTLTGSYN